MVMFPIGSTGSYASAKAIIMTPSAPIHGKGKRTRRKGIRRREAKLNKPRRRRRRRRRRKIRGCVPANREER
jgi:hypothetical protein